MDFISFDFSPFLLIPGLLLAIGVSFLIYSAQKPWGKSINRLLAALRVVLVLVLFALLLGPLIHRWTQEIERPKIILAIDNSESIVQNKDSLYKRNIIQGINALKNVAEANDYEVTIRGLGEPVTLSELSFDNKSTNLKAMLHDVEREVEGQNIDQVILLSDGRYNQGISPGYFTYPFKMNVIGIGDTISKKDLSIQQILYNKVAYQGNSFPVQVSVLNTGFEQAETEIQVWQGEKLLDREEVLFDRAGQLKKYDLEVSAEKNGFVQLRVVVVAVEGEQTNENNAENIFIDVVDGKQKILMAAPAPHPDIKAFSAAIERNQNFELDYYYGYSREIPKGAYDLIIVHQTYDRYNRTKPILERAKEAKIPVIHFVGAQSMLQNINAQEPGFSVRQMRNQKDQVSGALNVDFTRFSLADIDEQIFTQFPPVIVPFGEYGNLAPDQVLLFQKVGSVVTEYPLIYLNEEIGQKNAFIIGDNYWKWRMQEYAMTDDTESFDRLILKMVQYMSTKEDKRKLRCYPLKNEFYTSEDVQIQAELYDELYERVYGQEIDFKLILPDGSEREQIFTPFSPYDNISLGGLEEGIYQYVARTNANTKEEIVSGGFVVKELQLEMDEQAADFGLLRSLAANSGGEFYQLDEVELLNSAIGNRESKGVVHSFEDIVSLINLWWVLIVLLLMVSVEWLTRKYHGGY